MAKFENLDNEPFAMSEDSPDSVSYSKTNNVVVGRHSTPILQQDDKDSKFTTGSIVVSIILVIVAFVINIAAFTKTDNTTITKLKSLEKMLVPLNGQLDNLTSEQEQLSAKNKELLDKLAGLQNEYENNQNISSAEVIQKLSYGFGNVSQDQSSTSQKFQDFLESLIFLRQEIEFNISTANDSSIGEASSIRGSWFSPQNGYEYAFTRQRLSFNGSRKICQKLGGDLAVEGMKNYSTRLSICNAIVPTFVIQAWIGASDEVVEGTWVWINGESANDTIHWVNGEPNDNSGQENCAQVVRSFLPTFGTNDIPCRFVFNAICERRVVE